MSPHEVPHHPAGKPERIPPMVWEIATRDAQGKAIHHATFTQCPDMATGFVRHVGWHVVESATKAGGSEFVIGIGASIGIRIMIGRSDTLFGAQSDVRDVAHRLGHSW
jgi:hypothetical protein